MAATIGMGYFAMRFYYGECIELEKSIAPKSMIGKHIMHIP
jgi:hypothetical protein